LVKDELIAEGKEGAVSYVPRAHVQYLEQSGVRVVPIDYRLSTEDRFELMDQLNGVYMPGDSHMTVTDSAYKAAFVETLLYQEKATHEDKEHFPVFLMGNSLQTLVRARETTKGHLENMMDLKHANLSLQMKSHPNETFLFDQMTREEKQAIFNTASFFNKQASGLTLNVLKEDESLRKILKPLATFKTAGEDEFIAIAEGKQVPLYAFTYNLEMVQFYYEDPNETRDVQVLDHSIIAREHAQRIANLIADEARLCMH